MAPPWAPIHVRFHAPLTLNLLFVFVQTSFIDMIFSPKDEIGGLDQALLRICQEAAQVVENGCKIIVLSHQKVRAQFCDKALSCCG
jgi:hypothetical protein